MFPIVLRKSADIFVVAFRRRRYHREGYLRDLHARPQNDGHVALVGHFKGHVQEVAGIDDACCVVDHETDAGEGGFSTYLNEIHIGAEILFRDTQDRDTGMEDKFLTVRYLTLLRLRVYLADWIDEVSGALVIGDELIAEPDVVAHGLELGFAKRLERYLAFLHRFFNVCVGEEHGGLFYYKDLFGAVVLRPVRIIKGKHALEPLLRQLFDGEFLHEGADLTPRIVEL